jgi:glycosyltransferase involved in cell wall biosynthesis
MKLKKNLIIIGEGPEKNKLDKLIKKLNLKKKLKFYRLIII